MRCAPNASSRRRLGSVASVAQRELIRASAALMAELTPRQLRARRWFEAEELRAMAGRGAPAQQGHLGHEEPGFRAREALQKDFDDDEEDQGAHLASM